MSQYSYSMKFNEKAGVWIARVKRLTGAWQTKWLPRELGRADEVAAEAWLVGWYGEEARRDASPVPILQPNRAESAPVSIRLLAARWLDLRLRDPGTKPATYRGFVSSMNNWILDNDKFPHESIQDLDIVKELTVPALRSWFGSVAGQHSSKIAHASVLTTFFDNCMAEGWLKIPANPMAAPALKAMLRQVNQQRRDDKVIDFMPIETVAALLSRTHVDIPLYRQVRYLVAIGTGLRFAELQGLVWADLDLSGGTEDASGILVPPVLRVERQLMKRGSLPTLQYAELRRNGIGQAEYERYPNAIVGNPKKNSKRAVPLHRAVAEGLRWWLRTGWEAYTGVVPTAQHPVFPRSREKLGESTGRPGDFVTTTGAALLQLDLERLGLPGTFHDRHGDTGMPFSMQSCRSTFMTLLSGAGVGDSDVGVLAGHAGKTVTRNNYIGDVPAKFHDIVALLPLPRTTVFSAFSGSLLHCVGSEPTKADSAPMGKLYRIK